jgi:thymidylate synthase (FAD)
MQIIEPSFEILDRVNGAELLARIERYGRTCYKSEDKITAESAPLFIRMLLSRGHESVLEHEKITVRVICDRGVSHEIVRHRIAAYSQESTRYCNYGKSGEITVIRPCFWLEGSTAYRLWFAAMSAAETHYLDLLREGAFPQEARAVLPNSLKTEIVITYNLREWRHFFRLRTYPAAHPQMREITIPMLREFQRLVPVVFDDIEVR